MVSAFEPPVLHPLESWWVIGLSGALFLLEFVADKIPVRVPAGFRAPRVRKSTPASGVGGPADRDMSRP